VGHTDLLKLTAELVSIPSVSHSEADLADYVEQTLRSCAHLETIRIDDTVVARTGMGRNERLVLAGHLDTVPPFPNSAPRVEGETVWGLGAVDMKGGLAVLLDLATTVSEPACDVTYVFYACEEVAREHNALCRIASERPDLLRGDVAVLGEPTGGIVEAGCQGTVRFLVSLSGRRAHTARPWRGVNAIHRLGPVLELLNGYESRRVVIDGCEYAEQLQAVAIEGGIAPNVVPDRASLVVNHRFAPDRDLAEAERCFFALIADVIDERGGDLVEVVESSPAAPPSLRHPLLNEMVKTTGKPPRAKMGWTDVATFWEIGIPATNFGPGDPTLAHTADERVSRDELEGARAVLAHLLQPA